MKWCPLQKGEGNTREICWEKDCGLWDENTVMCSFRALPELFNAYLNIIEARKDAWRKDAWRFVVEEDKK